jgi:hypothetical protein
MIITFACFTCMVMICGMLQAVSRFIIRMLSLRCWAHDRYTTFKLEAWLVVHYIVMGPAVMFMDQGCHGNTI